VDKRFSIAELTTISSVIICKNPPKNKKVESGPMVHFFTLGNRE